MFKSFKNYLKSPIVQTAVTASIAIAALIIPGEMLWGRVILATAAISQYRNCTVLVNYEIHDDPSQKQITGELLKLLSPQNFTLAIEASKELGSDISLMRSKVKESNVYGADALIELLDKAEQYKWNVKPIDLEGEHAKMLHKRVGRQEWIRLRDDHMAQQIKDICKTNDVIVLAGLSHIGIGDLLEQSGHKVLLTFAERDLRPLRKTHFDIAQSFLPKLQLDKVHPFIVDDFWPDEEAKHHAGEIVKLLGKFNTTPDVLASAEDSSVIGL